MVDWSFIDADFFVRAGSGVLFAVLGGLMLAARPVRPGNTAFGLAALLFGIGITINNFEFGVILDRDGTYQWSTVLGGPTLYALSGLAMAATAWRWPSPLSQDGRRMFAVAAAVLLASLAASAWYLFTSETANGPVRYYILCIRTMYCGGALLTAASAWRMHAGTGKAWSLAAAAVAIQAMGYVNLGANVGGFGGVLGQMSGVTFARNVAYLIAFATPMLVGCALLARALVGIHRRAASAALLGLLTLATITALIAVMTGETPSPAAKDPFAAALPGLARIGGAALLAFALFRRDLLGVPLPSMRAHAGAVAVSFLVILFALAQVLENVVGGMMGLGIGAVVALGSVFVGPRIERLVHGRSKDQVRHEAVYREAVRLALRDGRIKPDEERHLVIMAEKLGVGAERAYAIKDEEQAARRARTGRGEG